MKLQGFLKRNANTEHFFTEHLRATASEREIPIMLKIGEVGHFLAQNQLF